MAPGVTVGGTGSITERGLAEPPMPGHMRVVSRNETLKVIVFDSANGSFVGPGM